MTTPVPNDYTEVEGGIVTEIAPVPASRKRSGRRSSRVKSRPRSRTSRSSSSTSFSHHADDITEELEDEFYEDDEEGIEEEAPPLEMSIAVMGASAVGKSALAVQFVFNCPYSSQYIPTVQDFYHVESNVNDDPVNVNIIDTGGLEFNQEDYVREMEGFCLVYAVNDANSFERCRELVKQIHKLRETQNVPIMLVENKSDLEAERAVDLQEARQLAESLGSTLISASAKGDVNVKQSFLGLINRCYIMRKPDLAGYVRKRNNNKKLLGRSWPRYWFEVVGTTLTYRRSPRSRDIIKSIDLTKVISIYKDKVNEDGTDWFIASEKAVVCLRCNSRDSRALWMQQLQVAMPSKFTQQH